jgi:hypothetical protein
MQHQLKSKYNDFRIVKNEDGQKVALLQRISPEATTTIASHGFALSNSFKTKAEDPFSKEAILALRQIHPRLAQCDKDLLDLAVQQLNENWLQRRKRSFLNCFKFVK